MARNEKKENNRIERKNILRKMQAEAGNAIVNYFEEASTDFKVQKLESVYRAAKGDGAVLLGRFLPKRVKFLINKEYTQPSYILPILGAEEFYLVCDCESHKCKIQEMSLTRVLEF